MSSFLANNLKTTQLELNTDLQTSRAIARLKEPRNLFALPKDKENECSQQTARWPAECQVQFCHILLLLATEVVRCVENIESISDLFVVLFRALNCHFVETIQSIAFNQSNHVKIAFQIQDRFFFYN